MRAWVKDNDMTDFTSILTYTADKFTPTGFLCCYKEKFYAETPTMMPTKTPTRPLQPQEVHYTCHE